MASLRDRVELWRSVSGKLHLPGENDQARCGLSSSLWEKTIGTLSDVSCLRCKSIAYEPLVEKHSQELQAKLQEPDPESEPETPKGLVLDTVFRFVEIVERTSLCWCGCGQPVMCKKARFVSGHDARLCALIRMIEKGVADEDIIPEELRQRMANC